MDIDDLGPHRDHARTSAHVVGIAHFGIGQDGEIVELDAVVLAVTISLSTPVTKLLVRLARASRE